MQSHPEFDNECLSFSKNCVCRGVVTGALGWICPSHFCQRLFLRLMQIRWVCTRDRWGRVGHVWSLTRQFAKGSEWDGFAASVFSYRLALGALLLRTPHFMNWRRPVNSKKITLLTLFLCYMYWQTKSVRSKPSEPVSKRFTAWNQDGWVQ